MEYRDIRRWYFTDSYGSGPMFRQRDPQSSLLESSFLVPEAKAERLRDSWAEVFRTKVLPVIDEEVFGPLYCSDNGRPNRPVQTVLGVHLLKEMFGLTDQEALEQLEFNLLWHHALCLTPEEAHLPQKTLHNFRSRLLAHDQGAVMFASITDRAIDVMGTNVSRQRLDSTHVVSNIAVLTRLGLFCETIRLFLKRLEAEHPRLHGRVSPSVLVRYVKPEGGDTAYQDARASEGQRRLSVCARDLYRLCELFKGTAAEAMESYGLLKRLLLEQCEAVRKKQRPSRDDDDAGEGGVPVVVKDPKEISSDSLQSPHDPDVTYSGRKGKGYEVQVAETCHEDNAAQMITHVEVSDACGSDAQATLPVLQALADRDKHPEELVADTAYGSGENAVAAERLGTELVSPVSGSKVEVDDVSSEDRELTEADFNVDVCAREPATCPGGHLSFEQSQSSKHPNRVELTFDRATCEACPLYDRCPAQASSKTDGYVLTVDLAAANLERRRRAEATGEFRERYTIRAGIEGTNSELKRRHGLDALRVRGRYRVALAAYLKALACNLKRMLRALMLEATAPVDARA
jgi:hypothetical protein